MNIRVHFPNRAPLEFLDTQAESNYAFKVEQGALKIMKLSNTGITLIATFAEGTWTRAIDVNYDS